MLVADTSAWVEYLRRTESPAHHALRAAVARDEVVLPEPVKAELLVGARSSAEFRDLQRMLDGLPVALVHPRDDFDAAVDVYRRCRAVGITPRGLVDCLLAAMVLRSDHSLLHSDRDLTSIASVMGIPVAAGSLAG
ncbi:MAG TPA: VapC toxin family PIN domain ribonuclease [Acidimicrobiaceae bacterium]|nr:VapC toxin family PIN domain ribonuclease [Acidimicrobiaceae bacterium]